MFRRSIVIPLCILLIAVTGYLALLPYAVADRKRFDQRFVLPPAMLRVASLQFKEVMADVLFLNALSYTGGIHTQKSTGKYLPEQYRWIHETLVNSATLDKYFLDPYNLMNSALIWDRYKLEEVNDTISKGADLRTWDSLLCFYAGFNYYYFLDNGDRSFYYLQEASKREGGNPFYDNFAARVAYKANKTELAISYLEAQIHQAEGNGDQQLAELLKKRFDVLKGIRQIEVALESYRNLFGKLPQSIEELKSTGLLAAIPREPNGGRYYLDQSGRVRSDKDLRI